MRKIYVEKSIIDYLSKNNLSIYKDKLNPDKNDNEWLIYIPLPSTIEGIMVIGTYSETWSTVLRSNEFVSIKCNITDKEIKYLVCTNINMDTELFVRNRDIYISYADGKKYCVVALNSSYGKEYDVIFDEMDYREAK